MARNAWRLWVIWMSIWLKWATSICCSYNPLFLFLFFRFLLWWLCNGGDWVVGRGGGWVVGCSGVAKMVCELLWWLCCGLQWLVGHLFYSFLLWSANLSGQWSSGGLVCTNMVVVWVDSRLVVDWFLLIWWWLLGFDRLWD